MLKFYLLVWLSFMTFKVHSQHVIDHARLAIQDFTLDPYTAKYEMMADDHYLYFSSGKNQIAEFDDFIFEGNCTDTIVEYIRRDFHVLQFDEDFNVTKRMVIDNIEENYHVMTRTDDGHVLLNHFDDELNNDSMAFIKISPNIEIPRADHLGASVLIKTDLDFNYVKHVFPTTGEISQIKGIGESVYMNINMAAGQEFILLNNDTVFNFRAQFGRENHIVLAKYNLHSETFDWWYRPFGNFINMYSNGLEIDSEGNCYQLLMTDAYIYLPNGDTARFGEYYAPVLIKYDPDGNIIWHVDFDETEEAFLVRLSLDDENNAYIDGSYYGSKLTIGDTILFASKPDEYSDYAPCVITQISKEGEFQWARQLNGTAYSCGITNVTGDTAGNIYAHGRFARGSATFNGVTYNDIEIRRNNNEFILRMDPETGADLGHVVVQGDIRIRNIEYHHKLFVQFELRDDVELYGQTFSTDGSREVYIVAIDDLVSGLFSQDHAAADLVQVYPNPILCGDEIIIQTNNADRRPSDYLLIDALGFVVRSGSWSHSNDIMKLSSVGLRSGLYALIVSTEQHYETLKILIK